MGAERAMARQVLEDVWSSMPPAAHTGNGGTTYQDKTIDVRRIMMPIPNSTNVRPGLLVASKTWIGSTSTGGWALTLIRYDYFTGEMFGSPYVYPGAPSPTDFFVPTAMEVVELESQGDPEIETYTRVLVTGYCLATQYGNMDYHTVCWTQDLGTPEWADKYSRPGFVVTTPGFVDEEPVDIHWSLGVNYEKASGVPTLIAGVTGRTWTNNGWDIQTVFHDIENGGNVLQALWESSSGNQNDKACGIRMFSDLTGPYPNCRAYVVGTLGEGAENAIGAYLYTASATSAGTWDSTQETLTGGELTANAMDAQYVAGTGASIALIAGRVAGVDQTHMLLAKLDFTPDNNGDPTTLNDYSTTFSWDPQLSNGYRGGEALAISYFPTPNTQVGDFIAISGYSFRDLTRGNDAIVCLYDLGESAPMLRWSAWLNPALGTEYDVHDACQTVSIDASLINDPGDPDNYLVYVAGQVPIGTADMDWRMAVFQSTVSSDPQDPETKLPWSNMLQLSGSASGLDIPRAMTLNPHGRLDLPNPPDPLPPVHNFVVVGDHWNGSTGFDIRTRRYRFTEPE